MTYIMVFSCYYDYRYIYIYIYYCTDTGKYYELDTVLPRVRRTSGMLYPMSNISWVSVR